MCKFKDKYFTDCLKGLSSIPDINKISLPCIYSSVAEGDQSQGQAFNSCANWESLKWVHYHRCMGWRQAVVYRRRKAANFHWAEDRSGQPPSAACEQEWPLYVWHVCTCNSSRGGGGDTRKLLCMCAPAHTLDLMFSLRQLIKIDQNATFTFVTLKKKNATPRNFIVRFF